MAKSILILIFILILIPSISFAYQNSTTWCLATNMSQVIANGTNSENITCNFGCNSFSGKCNSNPYEPSVFYLIFPVIAFVFFYFSSLLKEDDWFIHIILIAAGLFFIIVPLGVLSESFLQGPLTSLYYFTLVITFIIIFYNGLRVMIKGFQGMGAS